MPDFSNLKLHRALAEENEEDELDRMIAGHYTPIITVEAVTEETVVDSFDDTLQDLLDDEESMDDTEVVHVPDANKEPVVEASGIVRKGEKNPHGATNEERVTDIDARLYAHLAEFRVGTVQTLSLLQWSRFNPKTRKHSNTLMSPATVADRLKKGKRLGMVTKFKNPITGQHLWTVTDRGIAAARSRDYLQRDDSVSWGGAEGMGITQIDHYAAISYIAAKIVSPKGFYREVFGEVTADDLVSEGEIRRGQKPIKDQLFAESKSGKKRTFGEWRSLRIDEVVADLRAGKLNVADMLDFYPELWTIGQPDGEHPVKNTHWPDLVVSRERGRTKAGSESFGVELERTIKSTAELVAILRTIKLELDTPLIYGHFVYVGPAKVERKLRKIDEDFGLGLFDSGRFFFIALTDEEGNPLFARTTVGA